MRKICITQDDYVRKMLIEMGSSSARLQKSVKRMHVRGVRAERSRAIENESSCCDKKNKRFDVAKVSTINFR